MADGGFRPLPPRLPRPRPYPTCFPELMPAATGSGATSTATDVPATDAPAPATAKSRPAASGSAETDRETLVALYNATDGENWRDNANWLSDAPLGEWYGVTTDDDGRVTELRLRNSELSGEIPADLGGLSNLEGLFLSGNQLSGCIPNCLRDVETSDLLALGLPFCG